LIIAFVINTANANIIRNPTESQCVAYMLKKEAQGEPIKTQKAVLDVLSNRLEKSKSTACHELNKPNQYPYFKYGVKEVSPEWMKHYKEVDKLPRVLDNSFMYFNNTKHSFGRDCRKIHTLWFCK